MPEVYVHSVKGRTPEQKRGLIKDITEAVVKNYGVPIEAVLVQLVDRRRPRRPRAVSCSARCGASCAAVRPPSTPVSSM